MFSRNFGLLQFGREDVEDGGGPDGDDGGEDLGLEVGVDGVKGWWWVEVSAATACMPRKMKEWTHLSAAEWK